MISHSKQTKQEAEIGKSNYSFARVIKKENGTESSDLSIRFWQVSTYYALRQYFFYCPPSAKLSK
jgi:hypothetical protein